MLVTRPKCRAQPGKLLFGSNSHSAHAMRRSIIRLPVTFVSQYFIRLTIRRRLSTAGPPHQIPVDRAETPIDGCDHKHWFVVVDHPTGYPLRNQISERYIQTLASALDSGEEAKRSIYSVSTKYYYAFGCKVDENVIHSIKSMLNVRWILPDSHRCLGNNDYGVPYDEKFHEDWLQDQRDNGFRRRSTRKEQKMDSN